MDLDAITSAFGAIPTDWLIIAIFAIVAALDCLRSGARRACTLALALPGAALIAESLENAAFLGSAFGQFSTPVLKAVPFLVTLAIMYILIHRMGLSWGGEAGQALHAALTSVAIAALVATFWVHIPALDSLWHFGTQVQQIFGENYSFWWILGSFAALAYVRNS